MNDFDKYKKIADEPNHQKWHKHNEQQMSLAGKIVEDVNNAPNERVFARLMQLLESETQKAASEGRYEVACSTILYKYEDYIDEMHKNPPGKSILDFVWWILYIVVYIVSLTIAAVLDSSIKTSGLYATLGEGRQTFHPKIYYNNEEALEQLKRLILEKLQALFDEEIREGRLPQNTSISLTKGFNHKITIYMKLNLVPYLARKHSMKS